MMKQILVIASSLFFLCQGAKALENLETLTQQENKFIAGILFDQLKNQGEFANIEEETINIAKEIVQQIASSNEMLNNIKNGELILDEQFIADYFLKDTIGKVTDKLGNILNPVTNVVTTVLSPIKKIAGGIAYVANKALSAITDNDAFMTLLEVGIGIFNTLLPFGATALATASLAYPPAATALIPLIATLTPVLQIVVTPGNVTTALKVAKATASLADQFLNKPKSTTAPRNPLLALEKKSSKSSKEIGEALELSFKGGLMVQNFIKKAKKSGSWDKMKKEDRKELLKAADRANKLATLIDPKKLK